MTGSAHLGDDDAVQARGAGVASRHLRLVVPLNAAMGSDGPDGFPIQRSPDGSADDQSLTVLAW
jgi:hypothetical protein